MLVNEEQILSELNVIRENRKPTGWLRQLVGSLARSHGREQTMVHPCVIDGKQTLVYERGLPLKDPAAFGLVREFAITHGYQLKEDQRADFLEGIKRVRNKRRANAVSVLVLTAGMMSQAVHAKSAFDYGQHAMDTANHVKHEQVSKIHDFDFNAYHSEEELISGLLHWLNEHSSFDYDVSLIPDVKKVSAKQIAEVAFGGELPKSVDVESLKIFGLYNFREKAVYLLDTIDLDTTEGKGILLHELVHYLQYQNGIDNNVACKNELESLAYTLEARFLDDHDHRHKITRSHIDKVSQCRV